MRNVVILSFVAAAAASVNSEVTRSPGMIGLACALWALIAAVCYYRIWALNDGNRARAVALLVLIGLAAGGQAVVIMRDKPISPTGTEMDYTVVPMWAAASLSMILAATYMLTIIQSPEPSQQPTTAGSATAAGRSATPLDVKARAQLLARYTLGLLDPSMPMWTGTASDKVNARITAQQQIMRVYNEWYADQGHYEKLANLIAVCDDLVHELCQGVESVPDPNLPISAVDIDNYFKEVVRSINEHECG
jgi:hypothetical protein